MKLNLSRLQVFGIRVLCQVPGRRNAKLVYHVYNFLIGYGVSGKHIRHNNNIQSQGKFATHTVFDKAHNSSTLRPPGPQLLYILGFPKEESSLAAKPESINKDPYPPTPTSTPKHDTSPVV